jgi:cell division protein FtsL
MLFLSAGIIVFFVNNIIAVNNLVVANNNIRNDINKTATVNNNLQTEIERLSNYDNLKPIASDKLKLNFPTEKPKKIIIQKSELENLSQ